MTVSVKDDQILDAIYESQTKWVSVEVKIDQPTNPIMLFQITEDKADDRFYFRENSGETAFFGFDALLKLKNDYENKQTIFREWENYKNDIALIHPDSEKHHLKVCGGFQFSSHKSDDEWRQFGLNHFVLPKILITLDESATYITYTVLREEFDIEVLHDIVDKVAHTKVQPTQPNGNISRSEDIYKEEWLELVQEAIDSMNDEEKIVLARRRLIRFDQNIDIAYILENAMKNESNSYIFVMQSEGSIFFSQTPEQLMEVENQVLSTKAVAGTIRRTSDEEQDKKHVDAFLQDSKNLQEHHFVVQSILDDIAPYVNKVDYNTHPKILKNDHLYHLYTEIAADLEDKTYIGLLDRLHPTPALGGYPKDKAMDFIEQKEFGTRGLYGAPVGYIDMEDNCEFIVAIRSMLIKQDQATLYAGCGIIKQSDPKSELDETTLKFTPMMNALGVENHG
ncbi:isochorismate synthase [Staphylococcus simulans]|uniref:isochorismate synthase n=1 Tax=Staphylococcus simulans TaxID=1286 RepID=UPI000D03043C|nr:isochorismate synthase [Staphylococcus simulans]